MQLKWLRSQCFGYRLYLAIGFYAVLIYGDLCGQSDYLSSAGLCCPMCTKGFIVMKDCTPHSITTCKPCTSGTYMNEPNGLQQCFPCTTCDNGLYVSRECTRMQNAVCDVQDGYYCESYSGTGCSVAVKHRVCLPGQQIKTPGNKVSDTVCEDCPPGFYSPEGVNCTKWTDCSVKQQILDKEGSSIKDVKCKNQWHRYGLIGTALLAAAVSVFVFIKWFTSEKSGNSSDPRLPVEETEPYQPSAGLSSVTWSEWQSNTHFKIPEVESVHLDIGFVGETFRHSSK